LGLDCQHSHLNHVIFSGCRIRANSRLFSAPVCTENLIRICALPRDGAVVTLLAVCGVSHRESYFDIVMVAIVGAILGLAAVIVLGSIFGSF
jgi:hypothetical protein